jgi:hypothetical protein
MSQKTKIILITSITSILVILLGLVFLNPKQVKDTPIPSPETFSDEEKTPIPEETKKSPNTVTKSVSSPNTEKITILFGKEKTELSVPINTTFYDALMQAKDAGTLKLSGKNYPGLGFFVTEIGELRAENGKDLLYYINSKEANVGVSSYILKDGDIIEWKLE